MNLGARSLLSLIVLITLLLPMGVFAAEVTKKTPKPMLLGSCTRDSLLQEPYVEWFNKYHEPYTPNAEVIGKFDNVEADFEVTIFFGSWCGDSKRQVPRFLKVLDALEFPEDKLSLIGVTNVDSLKKQSPDGEERQQEIYRVPVFIVKRNGVEVNRIVEIPVLSLERDLLKIVSGEQYTPNYRSFPLLTQWLRAGLLTDANVSPRGLANQVRHLVSGEGELSAAGTVFLGRGLVDEAIKVFRMNISLYPESASRRLALAKALEQAEEHSDAEQALKKALELNDDPKRQDAILDLFDEVRQSLRQAAAESPEE